MRVHCVELFLISVFTLFATSCKGDPRGKEIFSITDSKGYHPRSLYLFEGKLCLYEDNTLVHTEPAPGDVAGRSHEELTNFYEEMAERSDNLAHDRWQAAERWHDLPDDAPPSRHAHDALLEAAEKLEVLHAHRSEDLLVLRDLAEVYVALLRYERDTTLGGNLALLAGEKLATIDMLKPPWRSSIRKQTRFLRPRLQILLKQYPLAAASADEILLAELTQLGQRYFIRESVGNDRGMFTGTYRCLDRSPDPDLLWNALFLFASPAEDFPPHRTVGFTLTRQGEGEQTSWMLFRHYLNRSDLLRYYGPERPSDETFQRDANQFLDYTLATNAGGAATR